MPKSPNGLSLVRFNAESLSERVIIQQKEPKLARARQIPEWDEYDQEIARFTRALAEEGKIHSRMATADANVLAGAVPGSGSGSTDAETLKDAKTIDGGLAEQPSGFAVEEAASTAQEPVRDEL